ncbi:hypothetical protein Q2T40_02090 [Winogradskyella maritima]|nr:hypothetical protein [Winogradskyella maritima]
MVVLHRNIQIFSGERVRLRFVNAAAASYFWLTFGGEDPMLVSADGLDVVPVEHNKTLIGVAETYDFIVTIPESGKLQVRATAQDGSGEASAFIGTGNVLEAPVVPEPNLIKNMKQMMSMGMKMGAPASKFNPSKNDSIQVMEKYKMDMGGMQMNSMSMMDDNMKKGEMEMDSTKMAHNKMDHSKMDMKDDKMKMSKSEMKMNKGKAI